MSATTRAARSAGTATVVLAAIYGSATAQEYCVACTGPDAVYRCVLDRAAPVGMPLKMVCITTLARQGGHSTCAVRGGTVFDCKGEVRRIDVTGQFGTPPPAHVSPPGLAGGTRPIVAPGSGSGGQLPPASAGAVPQPVATPAGTVPAPAAAAPQGSETSPNPSNSPHPAPAKPGPPKTVAEFAKQVSKSTGKELEKAGSAIKNGSEKVWDCLTSLLKSC